MASGFEALIKGIDAENPPGKTKIKYENDVQISIWNLTLIKTFKSVCVRE